MTLPLHIRVYDKQQLVYDSGELAGPGELGRQMPGEEGPYTLKREPDRWRLVIARVEEDTVSRKHVQVEPLAGNKCRLTNLRDRLSIRLDGAELKPKASCECFLPLVLTVGARTVRIVAPGESQLEVLSLDELTRPPGASWGKDSSPLPGLGGSPVAGIEKEAVIRWLHAIMGVLQSAAGSSGFFQQAVQVAVDLVGLDSCRVLLLEGGAWKTQALQTKAQADLDSTWNPSRTVMTKVRQEKKTCWQVPRLSVQEGGSLERVRAVVAAPILNPRGEAIGILYGDRVVGGSQLGLPQMTRLEAMLVELLASGIAAGLARLEQEKAALTARVQFEQFFTVELSRQLALNPDMLKGQDAEVTILFCDIRSFSRFSELLGPAQTVQWIGDVMGTLSECVLAEKGVLVDYIGDELMAMWGAPEKQPAHAAMACRAALQMLDQLPRLNERWEAILKGPMSVGIGISTGMARVGNTGSPAKFKYGPLGNTVNLASRVQGASKYLKARLLVTSSTRAQLDATFAARRLGKVRVVNIVEPVDLYELLTPGQAQLARLKEGYERALENFEKKDFRGAVGTLGNLLQEAPDDGPSLALLSRAVGCLVEEPKDFVPVWDLPGK